MHDLLVLVSIVQFVLMNIDTNFCDAVECEERWRIAKPLIMIIWKHLTTALKKKKKKAIASSLFLMTRHILTLNHSSLRFSQHFHLCRFCSLPRHIYHHHHGFPPLLVHPFHPDLYLAPSLSCFVVCCSW
jgi:hypothetical protein